MDKFINNSPKKDLEIIQKTAGNVKAVDHPIFGIVYVCPSPESHFSNLQSEADEIRFREIRKERI